MVKVYYYCIYNRDLKVRKKLCDTKESRNRKAGNITIRDWDRKVDVWLLKAWCVTEEFIISRMKAGDSLQVQV